MASNRIQALGFAQLETLSATLLGAASDAQASYGVSAAQVASLQSLSQGLAEAGDAVASARSALAAAIQERESVARATADAAASMARSIYAHPGITPGLIAAAGLSPRSTSKARIKPSRPIGLVALPQPNGDVLLTWSKAGNAAAGVVYVLEARVGAGEWRFVLNSGRTRLRLEAYAASGTTVAFRVSASANGKVSSPSAPATIYAAASESPSLRVAA